MLICKNCGQPLQAEAVIASSRRTWPTRWQDYVCPHCGDVGVFMIENDRLILGDIDGFPGPCFYPESEAHIPGLESRRTDKALLVRLNGKEWCIPYKSS